VTTFLARKLCVPAMLLFVLGLASPMFADQDDPPGRVARLSYISGNVSFQPSGEDQWSQATLNYPLTTGDRIFTDQNSRAELETGNIAVRLSASTDLTTSTLNDQLVQLGVAEGTLRVRAYDIRDGNSIEIDTPSAALTLLRPGSYRVEIYPDDATTLVTVDSGDLQIDGNGFSQTVHSGQSIKLTGSNDVQVDFVSPPYADDFDNWCGNRDRRVLASRSREYVGDYVPGYSDLDDYGAWESVPEYGQIWFPRSVAVGWVPYRYGHWAWVEPWGWTWVEDEPWGFAPFHYGRWVAIGPRWGWIPGPVVVRPVYAPALVAFVGGGGVSFGVGVQCWFPLGPRDPYFPWYHHSDGYLRQVNITNVTVRNVTIVNNYINVRNAGEVRYAYQRVGATAVSTEAFRSSQPVARQIVRVNDADLARARVIPHPQIVPDKRAIVAGAPVVHPPVENTRPFVEHRPLNPPGQQGRVFTQDRGNANRGGNPPQGGQNQPGGDDRTFRGSGDRRTVQVPNATPNPTPNTPEEQHGRPVIPDRGTYNPSGGNPTPNPTPEQHGRAVVPDRGTYNPPGGNPTPNPTPEQHGRAVVPDRGTFNPPPANPTPNPQEEQHGRPVIPDRGTFNRPGNPPFNPNQPGPAQGNNGGQGNSGGQTKPVSSGPPPQRPLVTNAPPPPPHPSFVQRQPALQDHPGRPLEPRQIDNIRQGQPAGQSHDREYSPHQNNPAPKPTPHSDDHGKKGH